MKKLILLCLIGMLQVRGAFISSYTGAQIDAAVTKVLQSPGALNAHLYGSDATAFAAMSAAGGTNLVIFAPAGDYTLDGYVFTNANVTIVGEGRATRFKPSVNTNVFRLITAGQKIKLSNLEVDGLGINKTTIYAVGVAELELDHVYVHGAGSLSGTTNSNSGVSFTSPTGNLIIRNSEFSSNEFDGVFAWPANEVTIEHCVANNNGRGGFVVDRGATGTLYDGYGSSKVFFSDLTTTNCQIGLYVESVSSNVCDITIRDSRIFNCGQDDARWGYSYGIAAGNYTRGIVDGNILLNFGVGSTSVGGGNAIVLTSIANDVTVSNNKIDSSRGHSILANNGAGTPGVPLIEGNRVNGAGLCGIFVYNFPKAVVAFNRIANSVQNAIQINTSSRASLIGNKCINSSRGTNDAYSGILLLSSLGVSGVNNEIESATQTYGLEHDVSSFPRDWIGNRISTYHTAWITNAGGTISGNIFDSHREFVGTAIPTIVSPGLGDYVRHGTAFVNGRKGWIYGSDSAWHVDWPLGNEALFVNTNSWNSIYRMTINTPDSFAFYLQRTDTVLNTLRILAGSTTNVTSGVIFDFMADVAGTGAPVREHYLSGNGLGLTHYNDLDQVVFHSDKTTRTFAVATSSPDPSAVLQADSTSRGFLPPRMTKAQRNGITSPADGLVVYQTDNTPGLRVRENGAWVKYTATADP